MFVNQTSAPVQIRLMKLVNNSSGQRILSVFLNSGGFRTPLVPEGFQLGSGYMAADDVTLSLRKDDAIEGFADLEGSVSYVIS